MKYAVLAIVAVLLALVSTQLVRAREDKSFSPAADMPAEWFWHTDAESAAKHAELIGKPAPEIKVAKWFSNEVSLTDTAGKVVVLDLWATWCGPCKKGMPKTNELARKYKDKGVVVAAICSDGDEAFVPKFITDAKLDVLPMAWDDNAATNTAFRGQWFPTYVAIDKKGTVRAIGIASNHVESVIEKLLAE
jgi:thiol-disulfide isomerase/thioredoxin